MSAQFIRVHHCQSNIALHIRVDGIRTMSRGKTRPSMLGAFPCNQTFGPEDKEFECTFISRSEVQKPLTVRETPEEIQKLINDVDPVQDIRDRLDRIERVLKEKLV